MGQIKKILIFVLCVAIGYVVARKMYLFYCGKELPSGIATLGNTTVHTKTGSGSYNFKRMVSLVEQAEEIKKNFYAQYFGPVRKQKKIIDVKQTHELLSELYREKVRLNRYMWEVKSKYKGDVPLKKRRTLLYYQKTIDACINDLELVLRKA